MRSAGTPAICTSALIFCFFKQKTAYEISVRDWSSDVCSSDLQEERRDAALDRGRPRGGRAVLLPRRGPRALGHDDHAPKVIHDRGYGREQADERGRSGVRRRTA